ncbi:SPW repeat domain-containing protein [Mesorhizobium tianshanense]
MASPRILGFRSDPALAWNAIVIGVLTLAVTGLRG